MWATFLSRVFYVCESWNGKSKRILFPLLNSHNFHDLHDTPLRLLAGALNLEDLPTLPSNEARDKYINDCRLFISAYIFRR